MEEYSETQMALLRKMYSDRIIGAKHNGEREVCRGFPNHLKSGINNELRKLNKAGLIRIKKARYGNQYSLEPRAIKKIEDILNA